MGDCENERNGALSPEEVIEILKKHNSEVSIDEAVEILNTIRFFVRIIVDQKVRGKSHSLTQRAFDND